MEDNSNSIDNTKSLNQNQHGGGQTPHNLFNAVNTYRWAHWCYLHHMEPIAWLLRSWIYLIYNSFVPYKAEIGKGTIFGYKGMAVVIHSEAKIGRDCKIGTCVTIGGGAGGSNRRIEEFNQRRSTVPVIGDRVIIGAGAKVLGNIVIGNDVMIGANAVVINDVPDRAIVAGVPAKIIRIRTEEEIN